MSNTLDNRNPCHRCSVKHLGKAKILCDEMKLGYPIHAYYALANMSEAEDEILQVSPKEARAIRLERIAMEQSLDLADVDSVYIPDFEALMMRVAKSGLLPEALTEEDYTI